MTNPSTPQDESELQQETWELLLEVMSHGERHGLNSDILTPYHTKLLGLIAAHLEAAVRSAEIKEAQRLAQKCINHTELFYDGDCYTYKAVRVGQITHELNNRLAQLRRTSASESDEGDNHE